MEGPRYGTSIKYNLNFPKLLGIFISHIIEADLPHKIYENEQRNFNITKQFDATAIPSRQNVTRFNVNFLEWLSVLPSFFGQVPVANHAVQK